MPISVGLSYFLGRPGKCGNSSLTGGNFWDLSLCKNPLFGDMHTLPFLYPICLSCRINRKWIVSPTRTEKNSMIWNVALKLFKSSSAPHTCYFCTWTFCQAALSNHFLLLENSKHSFKPSHSLINLQNVDDNWNIVPNAHLVVDRQPCREWMPYWTRAPVRDRYIQMCKRHKKEICRPKEAVTTVPNTRKEIRLCR